MILKSFSGPFLFETELIYFDLKPFNGWTMPCLTMLIYTVPRKSVITMNILPLCISLLIASILDVIAFQMSDWLNWNISLVNSDFTVFIIHESTFNWCKQMQVINIKKVSSPIINRYWLIRTVVYPTHGTWT